MAKFHNRLTQSQDDSRLASHKYACTIQKFGFNTKFSEFKIQNVGSYFVLFSVATTRYNVTLWSQK